MQERPAVLATLTFLLSPSTVAIYPEPATRTDYTACALRIGCSCVLITIIVGAKELSFELGCSRMLPSMRPKFYDVQYESMNVLLFLRY